MMKNVKPPVALLTFAQAMGAVALVAVGVPLGLFGLGALMDVLGGALDLPREWPLLLQCLCCFGVGVSALVLLTEFVLLCGRVRRGATFTEENVAALGRIANAFFAGGTLLLIGGELLVGLAVICIHGFLAGDGAVSPLWLPMFAFMAWAAALMVRAIQAQMKRAVRMQTEVNLTV